MNLLGYYDSDEIWIPDPILESKYEFAVEDLFLKKF
jgi:hypothetical protein